MDKVERSVHPVDDRIYNEHRNEFLQWYKKAKTGEFFAYYRGWGLHESISSIRVKDTAWEHACEGKVYLFLKRDKDDSRYFIFYAQKASGNLPKKISARLIPKLN